MSIGELIQPARSATKRLAIRRNPEAQQVTPRAQRVEISATNTQARYIALAEDVPRSQ